jgi:excisionase family DNA binding protein
MEEYGSPSLFFATLPDQAQPIMLYTDELDNLMNNSPNSPVQDRWLSVDELAGYVGIKRDTVYKWIMRRNMPAHKVGRLWKFRKEEIDVWVRSGAAGEREK